jgi:hypothetical protein
VVVVVAFVVVVALVVAPGLRVLVPKRVQGHKTRGEELGIAQMLVVA